MFVLCVYRYWFYSNVMINSYTEKIQNGLTVVTIAKTSIVNN